MTSTHSMAARSRLLCAVLTCWAHSPVLVQCRFTESATDFLKSFSLALNWNKVMRCCWKIWHNKNGIVKYFLWFCSGNVYRVVPWAHPDSKVHGTNMGPIWVLSAPDGPHVSPINLAIKAKHLTSLHEHNIYRITMKWNKIHPCLFFSENVLDLKCLENGV